jgi:hypothetical protein
MNWGLREDCFYAKVLKNYKMNDAVKDAWFSCPILPAIAEKKGRAA